MTPEEAIDYLLDPIGKREKHDDAIRMAIDALQKQIPKKPAERRDKYTGNDVMSCPNCGAYIGYRDGRTFVLSRFIGSSRCPECGQAIDFGGEDK